ncbi:hypothetical protein [Streptomyces sp. SS8]
MSAPPTALHGTGPGSGRRGGTSGGPFSAVTGVLVLAGGLARISPVRAYGPYRPDKVSFGSQPDWWVGFEGGLAAADARDGDDRAEQHVVRMCHHEAGVGRMPVQRRGDPCFGDGSQGTRDPFGVHGPTEDQEGS